MNKIRQAEIDEKTLDIAEKLLQCIEKEIDTNCCLQSDKECGQLDLDKLGKLIKAFTLIKPYF